MKKEPAKRRALFGLAGNNAANDDEESEKEFNTVNHTARFTITGTWPAASSLMGYEEDKQIQRE